MDTNQFIKGSRTDPKKLDVNSNKAASTKKQNNLWQLGIKSIKELETERGILASSRTEAYGCIFGRDSLITSLSLIRVYRKTADVYFLNLIKKILLNLAELQGKDVNIESGEEPGKCIHEFRPEGHEHLTGKGNPPWYLYPDKIMRNYDTADATPLFLMTLYSYYKASGDSTFIEALLPNIRLAINWLFAYGDTNNDGFIDYRLNPDRKYGGLKTQSWMDSTESVFFEKSTDLPQYPIAPVEVQAYTYVALLSWSEFFSIKDVKFSENLRKKAEDLKQKFNEKFVIHNNDGTISLASALDGTGRLLTSPRSSMAHCLYAAFKAGDETEPLSVLDSKDIEPLIERLFKRDLYVSRAGIRTLSSRSSQFDPFSYHNGSIWPHDTAIFAEGLENFGHDKEAAFVRNSLIKAYTHFKTPIELFAYAKGKYSEYGNGKQHACRVQAWSAASLLTSIDKVKIESGTTLKPDLTV